MPGFSALQGHGFQTAPLRVARAVETFLAGLRDGVAAYRRFRALEGLDRRSLRRMGLTRQTIAREAMFPTQE